MISIVSRSAASDSELTVPSPLSQVALSHASLAVRSPIEHHAVDAEIASLFVSIATSISLFWELSSPIISLKACS